MMATLRNGNNGRQGPTRRVTDAGTARRRNLSEFINVCIVLNYTRRYTMLVARCADGNAGKPDLRRGASP